MLVRDVVGAFEPQAFLCTDQAADPIAILCLFVRCWSIEVTFAEVRRHLDVEMQRQWLDLAIAGTTPCLLALLSLVTLSDALAAVRRHLWIAQAFSTSPHTQNMATIPRMLLGNLTEAACYPA